MSAVRSRATNFRARSIGIFAFAPDREVVPAEHPQPQRGTRTGHRPAGSSRSGGDRPYRDLRVAQRQPTEQHLQGVDQRCVGAPVAGQGRVRAGGPGGRQVGVDVAAAEGVDRLFGSPTSTIVACPAKARSRICHCTGSVSWNSSTSTIDQRARIRSRAGASVGFQRGGQPAQQVVVAEDPAPPLAPVDLGADRAPNGHPPGRRRWPVLAGRRQPGLRVVDHLARQRQCGVPVEDRVSVGRPGERAGRTGRRPPRRPGRPGSRPVRRRRRRHRRCPARSARTGRTDGW